VERQIKIESAAKVKALIADHYLKSSSERISKIGSVNLEEHQVSAVSRVTAAIDEFGGALLADDVGMGKTFVALTIARQYLAPLVVAPAALRDMWAQQTARVGLELPFHSFESLSRNHRVTGKRDLIIIDEAHHVRNPATIRYRELARLVIHSRVLLLSATPIHNKRRDIVSLLALFLGSRAESMVPGEIARCVVRRRLESNPIASRFPRVGAVRWKEIGDDSEIPNQLLALPPPVPASDGGLGAALIARGLLRQWCSSDAALKSAIRRRLARAMALVAALETGRYPTRRELEAWSFSEDSVQLAFPLLVATGSGDCEALLAGVREHEAALRRILGALGPESSRDVSRAEIVKDIRHSHRGISIVAFSQYAATIAGLFRELRNEMGIAALTARGARIAGGDINRREALERFAPMALGVKPPREIERISLLLTTDLLSEGVNLQDAGVVVHLDLPWTAARMEQRLGRIRRLASNHSTVFAYGIRPSRSAELLIGLERTIRKKMREAECADDPLAISERIRAILTSWKDRENEPGSDVIHVAAVAAATTGFIAFTAGTLICFSSDRISASPSDVLRCLESIGQESCEPHAGEIDEAIRRIERWLLERNTLDLAGIDGSPSSSARQIALRRVSEITHDARRHARQRILALAESARFALLGNLSAAAEAELHHLRSSNLEDEEWLEAISLLASPARRAMSGNRIVALLLFRPL